MSEEYIEVTQLLRKRRWGKETLWTEQVMVPLRLIVYAHPTAEGTVILTENAVIATDANFREFARRFGAYTKTVQIAGHVFSPRRILDIRDRGGRTGLRLQGSGKAYFSLSLPVPYGEFKQLLLGRESA